MTTQPTQEAPSSDVVEAAAKFDEANVRPRLIAVEIVDGIRGYTFEFDNIGDHGYWYDRVESLAAKAALASTAGDTLKAENERLREALTPSGDTKAAYMGEFAFSLTRVDECGDEYNERVYVPWTTIKEIMAFILARADARTALGSDQ